MKKLYCLLMLLALTGCIDKFVDPMVFASIPRPGYEPAFVARELGFLDQGQVHLAEFSNATEVVRALRNQKVAVAGLTLDEALGLRASLPDLQIFMAVDVSHGADVLMVRPNIKSLGQLKGKRIGVEKTASGAYFLSLILRAARLSVVDIKVVSLSLDEHAHAFRKGQVDAMVTFGAPRSILASLGAVVLFDSAQAPGKIVDVLVIRAADADKYSKQLHVFATAWFSALKIIQNEPARAYPIMMQHEHVALEGLEETMRGLKLLDRHQNLQLFAGNSPELLEIVVETHNSMKEIGMTVGSDDLSQFLNPRILTESGLESDAL